MRHSILYVFIAAVSVFCSCTLPAYGAELMQDTVTTYKAKVVNIVSEKRTLVEGTDTSYETQTIEALITKGALEGTAVEFENDATQLKQGDVFYLNHTMTTDGQEYYAVLAPDRMPVLLFFLILFLVLVVIFGGLQGVRGLASLVGSLVLIGLVLFPGIVKGGSPLLLSIGVSGLIIVVGSYITHGFNKTTTSAVLGMLITVIITGLLAWYAVDAARLTGIGGEEAVYLNFNTQGSIDFIELLMGGILIGLLGVLYDVSIGQSISIEELNRVAPHIDRWKIYKRGIRIGREHIGALVNTLAIAYVGASLPLLLLFYSSSQGTFLTTINNELFATEIIRTLIGSIGLVLAVPITTFLAVVMLIGKVPPVNQEAMRNEEERLRHATHSH